MIASIKSSIWRYSVPYTHLRMTPSHKQAKVRYELHRVDTQIRNVERRRVSVAPRRARDAPAAFGSHLDAAG